MNAPRIFDTPLAGRWYAAGREALRRELAALAPHPALAPAPGVRALIVPHAGYAYSGTVAMAAYARLDPGRYDRAVVLGPSHSVALRDCVSVLDAAHIRTPLGDCPADPDFARCLLATPFAVVEPRAHAREHSDQIQIPLLQTVFAGRPLRVVSLVCGGFGDAAAQAFGQTLRGMLDDRTLLVVSTDFTHYGPAFDYVPFTDDVPRRLRELDHRVFERIVAGDAAGFRQVLLETGATVCGAHPLAIGMAVAGPEATVGEIAYDQSGRMTGDWTNSVSYLSAWMAW
jgi:AmmeMemoRadiSam system protein B